MKALLEAAACCQFLPPSSPALWVLLTEHWQDPTLPSVGAWQEDIRRTRPTLPPTVLGPGAKVLGPY